MGKKTQERIILIKFLLEKGRSQAQITRETGIPQQTVSRLVIKINNNDQYFSSTEVIIITEYFRTDN